MFFWGRRKSRHNLLQACTTEEASSTTLLKSCSYTAGSKNPWKGPREECRWKTQCLLKSNSSRNLSLSLKRPSQKEGRTKHWALVKNLKASTDLLMAKNCTSRLWCQQGLFSLTTTRLFQKSIVLWDSRTARFHISEWTQICSQKCWTLHSIRQSTGPCLSMICLKRKRLSSSQEEYLMSEIRNPWTHPFRAREEE